MSHQPSDDSLQKDGLVLQDENTTFRQTIKQARELDPLGWEATRKLVGHYQLHATRSELVEKISQASLPEHIRESLLQALAVPESDQTQLLPAEPLKQLTGLPPTKAFRALCLYFRVGQGFSKDTNHPTTSEILAFLAHNSNPYDLLLLSKTPTLLDLGAGDLSFEEELVEQYVPQLIPSHRSLVIHAIDRLHPGSQFGGAYHASQERLRKFSAYPPDALQFRFWGSTDMAESIRRRGLLSTYTIVTCHSPATPTFAFEPSRVPEDIIASHLERTKGAFRTIRVQGEEALEVQHRGKLLTFPPWKFAIQGPLVLLELLARRGRLGVLSAVDNEVFWEILSQLLEDLQFRPANVIFTPDNLPDIFGAIYRDLSALKVGDRLQLGEVASLRSKLPYHMPGPPQGSSGYRFHSIEIRRGATFPSMPASFTARQFSHMREEPLPWCLLLTPEFCTNP